MNLRGKMLMPRNPLRAWLHTFAPATAALLFAVPVFALAQTPTPAPQNAPAAPPQQSAPSTAGQQPTPPAAGQQATPTPGSDEGEFTIRRRSSSDWSSGSGIVMNDMISRTVQVTATRASNAGQ